MCDAIRTSISAAAPDKDQESVSGVPNVADSALNRTVIDNVMERSSRRNKCKSAAVLLGLVKSRIRRADSKSSESVNKAVDTASRPRANKKAKLEASDDLQLKCNLNIRKSLPPADLSLSETDGVIRKEWLKPFECGWRREVVHRGTSKSISSSKPNADVYYFAPERVKLRSMPEVIEYLKRVKSLLTSECFTFIKQPIYHEPHELVRLAGVAKGRQCKSDLPIVTKSLLSVDIKAKSNSSIELCDNAAKSQESSTQASNSLSALSTVLKSHCVQKKSKTISSLPVSRMIDMTSARGICGSRGNHSPKFKSGSVGLSKMATDVKCVGLEVEALPHSTNIIQQVPEQNTSSLNSVADASGTSVSVKRVVNKDGKQPKKCLISIGAKEKVVRQNSTPTLSTNNVCSSASCSISSIKKTESCASVAPELSSANTSSNLAVSAACSKFSPAAVAVVKISGSRASIATEFGSADILLSEKSKLKNTAQVSTMGLSSSDSRVSNKKDMRSRMTSSAKLPLSINTASIKAVTSTSGTSMQNSNVDLNVSKTTSSRVNVSNTNTLNTSSVDGEMDITRSTTLLGAHLNQSGHKSNSTSFEFRLCGLDCAGRFGVPPSLYCDLCMSAFHPECAGFSYFAHKTGFNCKACHQLQKELINTKYCLNNDGGLSTCDDISLTTSETSSQHITPQKPVTSSAANSLVFNSKQPVVSVNVEQYSTPEANAAIAEDANHYLSIESKKTVISTDVEQYLTPKSKNPITADVELHLPLNSMKTVLSINVEQHLTPRSNHAGDVKHNSPLDSKKTVILIDVEQNLTLGSNQPVTAEDVEIHSPLDATKTVDAKQHLTLESNHPRDATDEEESLTPQTVEPCEKMSLDASSAKSRLHICKNGTSSLTSFPFVSTVVENQEHQLSTDDTKEENQILILPVLAHHMLNPSLPVKLVLEDKHFMIPPCCYQISEAELLLSLPVKALSSDYLTGSSKPIICEVVPGSKDFNQTIRIALTVHIDRTIQYLK